VVCASGDPLNRCSAIIIQERLLLYGDCYLVAATSTSTAIAATTIASTATAPTTTTGSAAKSASARSSTKSAEATWATHRNVNANAGRKECTILSRGSTGDNGVANLEAANGQSNISGYFGIVTKLEDDVDILAHIDGKWTYGNYLSTYITYGWG
jgi:hypothetical protein